jgi:hypothetical protein
MPFGDFMKPCDKETDIFRFTLTALRYEMLSEIKDLKPLVEKKKLFTTFCQIANVTFKEIIRITGIEKKKIKNFG